MKAEISSPVWPTGVHTYPVKTAFNENASFQKFSTEWRFLKMPICCIRVRGWNRRFLITITSRCWIPLCAYSHQCAFVWKGKDDSKTQLKRHEFFWKRRKKTNPFSDKKGYLWKGTNFTTKRSSTIAGEQDINITAKIGEWKVRDI